jgi:galactose-6-phosphate isomerase
MTAQIDVSDVLLDPDFTSPVCLIDRKNVVDNYGQNSIKEVPFETVGSIQPASGKVIARLPEAMRVANLSSFWVRATIIASAPGKYSSILVFNGQRYQVMTVFDWSNYGAGFTEGVCVAEVPA